MTHSHCTIENEHALIARAGYAAWNEGDGVEAVLARCHPDVEWSSPFPEAMTARGHAAVREWFAQIHEVWDKLEFIPDHYETRGSDLVVRLRVRGVASLSGLALEMALVQTWTVRDGKAAAMRLAIGEEKPLMAWSGGA